MAKNWPRYKWRVILSSFGFLFHLCTVVLVLVLSGGIGEGQAGVVFFIDLPLSLIVLGVPQVGKMLSGPFSYILFFSFFGTAMYAVGGWVVGYFIDLKRISVKGENQ
ncbi:MAG: hypothetical protein R3B74_16115 [Nitrospirales bacterium]|nr:hypothetical protein [Nitrospirales bacterium]